jgi:putative PIN family toxin of toxin-antitoxin system
MISGVHKLKVVLDTNVYISALLFGGVPEEIIELVRDGEIRLFVSAGILLELARVLEEKFKFPKRVILNVIAEIKRISSVVYPNEKIDAVKNDPMDNQILECAVAAQADILITGDKKHLRPLNRFRGIDIRLPGEFIKGRK